MSSVEAGSPPQYAVDRAQKFLDAKVDTFRNRNKVMEAAIAKQLGVISQLPTELVKRDEDFLKKEGLLLQKALGLTPHDVLFIYDDNEADDF